MIYLEKLYNDINLQFTYSDVIYDNNNVKVLNSDRLGKTLLIDDVIQTSELDGFIYNEAMVHVGLNGLHAPRRVLLVGIGTGGSLKEILKTDVDRVYAVDLNEDTTYKLCELFGNQSCLKDPRVTLVFQDASIFLKNFNKEEYFDLIINDISDPIGDSEKLIKKLYYKNVYNALSKFGGFVTHLGVPFYQQKEFKEIYTNLTDIFPCIELFSTAIPTYHGGNMLFSISSKTDMKFSKPKKNISFKGKFYNYSVHESIFALPQYILDILPATN